MIRQIFTHFLLAVGIALLSASAWAQQTATLTGSVTDINSKSPLAYATVRIEGVPLGASTDVEGQYRIFNIPAGEQVIIVRYLGYQEQRRTLSLSAGESIVLDIAMEPEVFTTKEVVISAQLEGQQAAINRQLASNTIVNIVSKEKIQQLPDQNAAETVGRLPGISVQRDAGEGTKIVVRGLSPRFNSITVNGERIPSTDAEDRSVDLSMISTDALEGIEVFKALTPDKDGDAVGGTVNFVTRKAPKGFHGSARLMGGYNSHESEYGQYRGNLDISKRFFDDKLGLIVSANFQRANRSSDFLDTDYNFEGQNTQGEAVVSVNNLNLTDRLETRYRYGGSLTADYDLKKGNILLNSFWGNTERNEVQRRRRYRVGSSYQEHEARTREINTRLSSTSLSGTHNFGFLKSTLFWRTSASFTFQNTPYSHRSRFRELGAFTGALIEDQGPELIPLGAKNNLGNTWFLEDYLDADDITDRNLTAQVDYSVPFQAGSWFEGLLKIGGKIRDKTRKRDITQDWTAFGGTDDIADDNPERFQLDNEGRILMSNFIGGFDAGEFLKGQYTYGPGLDAAALDGFASDFRNYYVRNEQIDLEDYSASERINAAYFMAQLHFLNKKLMILPGVRMEYTQTAYNGTYGIPAGGAVINKVDTTGTRDYTEWLPMLHLQYKFASWVDLRLAVTRSLSRPNYFNLVPWQRINTLDGTVSRGAPDLLHTKVWNYDAFLSFYNKLGLLTIGGFYKELDDIDYLRVSRITTPGQTNGYQLTQPENAQETSTVYGGELELQTNLRFLPKPFNGILLSANYSYIFSETFYPFLEVSVNPNPPFNAIFKDTARAGRIPGQAVHIANFSLGYERGGFSGRVSMVFQGESLDFVGTRSELDGFSDTFTRWDLTMKQKLPEVVVLPRFLVIPKGFVLLFNVNNLTNTPERAFLGSRTFLTREAIFGWTGDIGLKYAF